MFDCFLSKHQDLLKHYCIKLHLAFQLCQNGDSFQFFSGLHYMCWILNNICILRKFSKVLQSHILFSFLFSKSGRLGCILFKPYFFVYHLISSNLKVNTPVEIKLLIRNIRMRRTSFLNRKWKGYTDTTSQFLTFWWASVRPRRIRAS